MALGQLQGPAGFAPGVAPRVVGGVLDDRPGIAPGFSGRSITGVGQFWKANSGFAWRLCNPPLRVWLPRPKRYPLSEPGGHGLTLQRTTRGH